MNIRMRKSLLIVVVLMLVFALGACTSTEKADNSETAPATEAPKTETASEEAPKTEATTQEAPAEKAYYPVTISNFNRAHEAYDVTFEKAPEKVFAVYQDSIETLLALGLEDRIVACAGLDQDVKPEYAEAFAKVNYLTEFSPDKESVMMLEPDMIVSWYSYFGDKKLGDVPYWNENGIGTYMMRNSGAAKERTLQNEYEDILDIGKVFNVEDKAQAIVDEMKSAVDKVVDETKDMEHKPRVLVMEVEKNGIRVYGENTLAGDMVKNIGAELVTAPENHMSSEELIASNPDVIFSVYFGSSSSVEDGQASVDKLVKDAKYASLSAIKDNKVFPISLGEVYCSGTRTLDGIKTLTKGIYPELAE